MQLSQQCTHGVSHGSVRKYYSTVITYDTWAKGITKSPEVMALVQLLQIFATYYNINISVQHTVYLWYSKQNCSCHFSDIHFRELAPDAEATPTNILAWQAQTFNKITSCSSTIMVSPSQPVEHQSGLIAYTSFCSRFNINPLLATSITSQYFVPIDQSLYHTNP